MTINLRGIREAGAAFAIPTYIFMFAILGMCGIGLLRWVFGDLPQAESASLTLRPESGFEAGLVGLGGAFLLLRAFSSGCAALTGVEAISNGVPAFKPPKSRNAATTLALLGGIAVAMLMGIITLANVMHVRYAEFPADQLYRDGRPVGDGYLQDPIIGQLARGVFSGFPPAFYLVAAATGLILVLAANTAFNGFPVLTSILAHDDLMPHQLRTRGDRLAFSNGIMILSVAAIILIVAFDAEVTRLIQLYIVGVFISFTTSQTGMVRHWTRLLRTEPHAAARGRMRRARIINATGLTITGGVLIVVLITKFSRGAWITLLGMACLFVIMMAIKRHYNSVRTELAVGERRSEARVLPSRVHAIVLVSNMHKPTLRALAYARAARPSVLEALTVAVEPEEAQRLQEDWFRRDIPVPLRIVESPYREITRPIVEYVTSIRKQSPRDLVVVYIPEYVVGHWWETILHNQSALRLRNRLHHTPGVMIASVPWQLRSSARMEPLTATEVEKLAEPDRELPPDTSVLPGGDPVR
jgi:amino acid transporter